MMNARAIIRAVIGILSVAAVGYWLFVDAAPAGAAGHEHMEAATDAEWSVLLGKLRMMAAYGTVMLLAGISLFQIFIWPRHTAGEAPAHVVRLERLAAAAALSAVLIADPADALIPLKAAAAAAWVFFAWYRIPSSRWSGVIKGACAVVLIPLLYMPGPVDAAWSEIGAVFAGALLALSGLTWLGGGMALYVALSSLEKRPEWLKEKLLSRFEFFSRMALAGVAVAITVDLALRIFAESGQADGLIWLLLPLQLLLIAMIAWTVFSAFGRWRRSNDERRSLRLFHYGQSLRFALSLTAFACVVAAFAPPPLASGIRWPQEPIYWHAMGAEAHMSLRIGSIGTNEAGQRVRLDVWLPSGMGQPAEVTVALQRDDSYAAVPVAFKSGGPDPYGFEGFDKYTYEAAGSFINEPGEWLMTVEVIDSEQNRHRYEKKVDEDV